MSEFPGEETSYWECRQSSQTRVEAEPACPRCAALEAEVVRLRNLLDKATKFYLGRYWIHDSYTNGACWLERWGEGWRVRAHEGGIGHSLFLLNEMGEPWRYKVGTCFPTREAALARFERVIADSPVSVRASGEESTG